MSDNDTNESSSYEFEPKSASLSLHNRQTHTDLYAHTGEPEVEEEDRFPPGEAHVHLNPPTQLTPEFDPSLNLRIYLEDGTYDELDGSVTATLTPDMARELGENLLEFADRAPSVVHGGDE